MEDVWKDISEMNSDLIGCEKCPRLVTFRKEVAKRDKKFRGQEYWSRPVPGYGDISGRLLIVGLAPAATGGNRTGRVFTGDKSSDFLVSCLFEAGITNQPTSVSRGDGLVYIDSYITAAVKCVPPDNKPTMDEIKNCMPYLIFEVKQMKNLKVVLALGKIAFDSVLDVLRSFGTNTKGMKFVHGNVYDTGTFKLVPSYHPSPRNVNTGKLKREDFVSLLQKVKALISE